MNIDWRSVIEDNTNLLLPKHKMEVNINCPWHDDKSPSLSINLKKGVGICHRGCWQGTLKSFLCRYLDIPLMQVEMLVRQNQIDSLLDFGDDDEEKEEIEVVDSIQYPFVPGNCPQFIRDRGFNSESITRWEFSANPETGSLIIPVRDAYNKIVGWVSRTSKKTGQRFVYSKGLKTSNYLFGEDKLKLPLSFLCITEGPLDTIWLDQYGFSSVALFGINMSIEQEQRLLALNANSYVLCLDNDEAGQSAIQSLSRRLQRYVNVEYIQIPESKTEMKIKDVQDIRDEQLLRQVIENRSIIRYGSKEVQY